MRFSKKITAARKEYLTELLRQYEERTPMNSEERAELRQWVMDGNSPYDNGWNLCDEDGCPLDFVSAMRIVHDETVMSNAIYTYDTCKDEPAILVSDADSVNLLSADMPF